MKSLLYILGAVLLIIMTASGAGLDPSGKAPLYLGMNYYQEPLKLGGASYSLPEQSEQFSQSFWPHGADFNFTPNRGYALYMESMNISNYHVPSIVNFLKDDFGKEGIDYSYHIATLGDFASPNWSPTKDIHIYHVPAITNFLRNDWQPPQPDYDYYPPWIFQYIKWS